MGMVFVPGRRRRIEPATARSIAHGLRESSTTAPKSVGLFGDQPLNEVLETIGAAGIDYAQLCGDESIDYCREVQHRAGVIKVLHVPADSGETTIHALDCQIRAFADAGCTVTLDSEVVGLHGGTGQSFDWRVASALAEHRRFACRRSDARQRGWRGGIGVSLGSGCVQRSGNRRRQGFGQNPPVRAKCAGERPGVRLRIRWQLIHK